jgi:hypothetical protein
VYSRPQLVTAKNYGEVPTESYSNQPPKEFSESPDYVARRGKTDDFLASLSVQDLNIELDKNRTPATTQWTRSSRCWAAGRH